MIRAEQISHFYGKEQVLFDLNLSVNQGEFIFLRGESGSGKSTLLSVLSTLLKPSEGEIWLDDTNTRAIKNMDDFRQHTIGFVFQFHYLINYLNVYENIELAATHERKSAIMSLLCDLGIDPLAKRYPNQISGGQRQRVALARALINQPKIIFADEPTGSLDSKNSTLVYELLKDASNKGTTIIVASHDPELERYATRTIRMKDGTIY